MNSFEYYRDRFVLCGVAVAFFVVLALVFSAWLVLLAVFFAFFAGYNIAYMTMHIDNAKRGGDYYQ